MNGWVFDIAGERDGMTVWFRTAAGETIALFAPFRPSFLLAGNRLKEPALRAAAARWKCDLARGEGIDFLSGRAIPAWSFTVPGPALLGPSVRKAEKAFGPEALCNADIAPEQQFSCAIGLYPLSRAAVDCDGDGTIRSARVLDSPWDVDAPHPSFSIALLRMEGTGHPAHRRVRPLEFIADGVTQSLLWENGADFLRELARLVERADPDLLVTEYGDDWLLPRLLALAGRLRVPLPLGRPPRTPDDVFGGLRKRGTGIGPAAPGRVRGGRERSYVSYGRVIFRAAPHTLAGRWHVDARNSFLFGETGLPGLVELSRLSGIPLQRVARTSPGTAISAMQVATALKGGILVPYKKREPEAFKSGVDLVVTDKGGLTYLPRPGAHENVGELDFASMYPSLMDRYNIYPETVNCACCRPGLPVPSIRAHTCLRRRGLVPDTIAPILVKRRLLKERQKAATEPEARELFRKRQTALKWLLVVSFAFLHGLTDAIWVKKEGAAEEDYRGLSERITVETGMPIALEGVYKWLAFLPSKRNRSVAVPNRFAGAFTNGEIKVRGIALRRSDTPPLVVALQRELLERMAKAGGLSELRAMLPELREGVDAAVSGLRGGRIPMEGLAIARRLSKAPERYVANTAAAAATRELCGRGVDLRPGSKIRYLLADRGGRAIGFLDGTETPDVPRYEAMLREAADELMEIVACSR
ncbi:MAG TPA: DNA polymerase domain-containing protein [Candidatus Deferrimicrobium sp.]